MPRPHRRTLPLAGTDLAGDIATFARDLPDLHQPVDVMLRLHALQRRIDQLKVVEIARLREAGMTWEKIGQLMGVSKQAAHRMYRDRPAPTTDTVDQLTLDIETLETTPPPSD